MIYGNYKYEFKKVTYFDVKYMYIQVEERWRYNWVDFTENIK